jgi:cyclin-dependent kinase 6
MESGQILPDSKIKSISHQMLNGLDFLHQHRVCHRDLKPQNILLSNSGQIKIADFGLARIYSFNMALTSIVVTLWYRPPEVLLQSSYATPVDLWSVGCIIAELFNLKPLFPGSSEVNQLTTIFDRTGMPSIDDWPSDSCVGYEAFPRKLGHSLDFLVPRLKSNQLALDLVKSLLCFNQHNRIRASESLSHAWFQQPEEIGS